MSEQTEHPDLSYFRTKFEALMGFSPMPWQERLFVRFMSDDLPVGRGHGYGRHSGYKHNACDPR
jgi:hypothetical protein